MWPRVSNKDSKPVTSSKYRGRSCKPVNFSPVLRARAILSASRSVATPETSIYGTSDKSRVSFSNVSPCRSARSRSRSSGDDSMVRRPSKLTRAAPSLRVTLIVSKLPAFVA
jgi:hypothetical protein